MKAHPAVFGDVDAALVTRERIKRKFLKDMGTLDISGMSEADLKAKFSHFIPSYIAEENGGLHLGFLQSLK